MPTPRISVAIALTLCVASAGWPAEGGGAEAPFFPAERLTHPHVTMFGGKFHIPVNLGPTGAVGWRNGNQLIVMEVDRGSPGHGILRKYDVIMAANGLPLSYDDPRRELGAAITESEAKDGRLSLSVLRRGKRRQVIVKLPVLGSYGSNWPYDCAKSKRIVKGACEFLAKHQTMYGDHMVSTRVGHALNGLFLLAADDPEYLETARRLAYWLVRHPGPGRGDGTGNWDNGYQAIFLAEYYLKTGDAHVLPRLREIHDLMVEFQDPCGSWGHGPRPKPGYVQGGLMNPAGLAIWVSLILSQECGLEVNEDAVARATRFFARYADKGNVPYGDHRPEFWPSSNGKNALAYVGLSLLDGREHREAALLFARLVADSYHDREAGHTGGFMNTVWGAIAAAGAPPADYRRHMDYWSWYYDLSRTWDGGFLSLPSPGGTQYTQRGVFLSTGGLALAYTVPLKSLRILGGPRSVFGARDLSATLMKGLQLYDELGFGELEALLSSYLERERPEANSSVRLHAQQLLAAARAKKHTIEHTLRKADRAFRLRHPGLAKRMLEDLDILTHGQLPRVRELLREARSPKYASIFEAEKVYNKHVGGIFHLYPPARRALKELASDPGAGYFSQLAKRELQQPLITHHYPPRGELDLGRFSAGGAWRTDELARAGLMRLARARYFGGNWTTWIADDTLREAGYIKHVAERNWEALLPIAGEQEKGAAKWRFLTFSDESKDEVPTGWSEPSFDDSQWREDAAPLGDLSGERPRTAFDRGDNLLLARIRFDADRKDFTEWALQFRFRRDVEVYLNGELIAWLSARTEDKYYDIELPRQALRYLRKGENVLAVRARADWNWSFYDIGLYARGETP